MMLNRRELLSLVFTGIARAATLPGNSNYKVWERRYRANAVILFCGVQIFSKSGVGGGYAVVEELRRNGITEVSLQFAGGSWPEKAHGINRLGFIQETVTERPSGQPTGARYFGFMTSSGEKSLEQAKESLHNSDAKPVPYTATQGAAENAPQGGCFRSSIYHMLFPSSGMWSTSPGLIRDVRSAVDHAAGAPLEPVKYETPNTFLNSVRRALTDPSEKTDTSLVYNGKLFRLETSKQPDGPALTRLNGMLHEAATGQRTPFHLWFEKNGESFLPVRIEYRAKSFLKLVFERDDSAQQPPITFFLDKENA